MFPTSLHTSLTIAAILLSNAACHSAEPNEAAEPTEVALTIRLADGSPAANGHLYGLCQFAAGKPGYFPLRVSRDRNAAPITVDEKGAAKWAYTLTPSTPRSLWAMSDDHSQAAIVTMADLSSEQENTVTLAPVHELQATCVNSQANELGIDFLHRGYLYSKTGQRVAQLLGDKLNFRLPDGTYQWMGYNGNPNNILVDVPRFRIEFDVRAGKASFPKVVDGKVQLRPSGETAEGVAGIADVDFAPGKIALERNQWLDRYAGQRSLTVPLVGCDGAPYRGSEVYVTDRENPRTIVYYGNIPDDGTLLFKDIKPGKYRISVDGLMPADLRQIEVTDEEDVAVDRQMMPPMPGYRLDDLHLLEPHSREAKSLASFRGQVLYIEFWASWCGPCIAAMNHVESVLSEAGKAWDGRVQLLAVNVDADPEKTISQHVLKHQWKAFDHLYGGAEDAANWDAPALKQLQANGIPLALIVDVDGRIVWRGHPESIDVRKVIQQQLDQANKN